jgi:hypothetical protein
MNETESKKMPALLRILDVGGSTRTLWHLIVVILFVILFGVGIFYYFYSRVLAGNATFDLLIFFFVVVTCVVGNVILQYFRLKHDLAKSPDLKFFAEIFAGLALLSIGSQFLQLGTALDNQFGPDRASTLQDMRTRGQSLFKCTNVKLDRSATDECNMLIMHFDELKKNINDKNEESTATEISTFISVLEKAKEKDQYHVISKEIDQLVFGLKALDRSEKLISKLFKLFPIISLWAASIAVSTKVSIALYERNKKRKEDADKKKQEKIDQAKEDEAQALEIEKLLAWKEEMSKTKAVGANEELGIDLRIQVDVGPPIVLTSVLCLALAVVYASRRKNN